MKTSEMSVEDVIRHPLFKEKISLEHKKMMQKHSAGGIRPFLKSTEEELTEEYRRVWEKASSRSASERKYIYYIGTQAFVETMKILKENERT